MNSTSPVAAPSQTATFGVAVRADGSIETIKQGSFDAGQADQIAAQLVLLAAAIRSTARQRLFFNE